MDAKSMLEAVYIDLVFAGPRIQQFCENMHISSKIHTETYISNLKCKKKIVQIVFLYCIPAIDQVSSPGVNYQNRAKNLTTSVHVIGKESPSYSTQKCYEFF